MAKIYISSTYSDLIAFREAVYRALRRMRHDVIAMEDYVAADRRPVDKCLADVAACEVYVGIFGWRYGYVPPGGEKSITELEFRQAVATGVECLIFLLDDEAPCPAGSKDAVTGEGDAGGRIAALRQELKRDYLVSFFESPEDLAVKVSAAVSIWEKQQRGSRTTQTGGIRAGRIQADNVVDGVQIQGGDAETAQGLVDLARAIQRGGIHADEIEAASLVSGLQYITDPDQVTADDLRREIAALRGQVEEGIAVGDRPGFFDAKSVRASLIIAEEELAASQPQVSRVMRRLLDAAEILDLGAREAQAAGDFDSHIIRASAVAAALCRIARDMWGG